MRLISVFTAFLLMLSTSCYACNQEFYDRIYRIILINAIYTGNTELRNTEIQNLRILCNGQLSTYELKNKGYSHVQNYKTNKKQRAH